jgi:hypothetical protein
MASNSIGQELNDEKPTFPLDEKGDFQHIDVESTDDSEREFGVLHNERDIATHVISVADDPSLNPWTVRAFIIGIGLSAFGGVLGTTLLSTRSTH